MPKSSTNTTTTTTRLALATAEACHCWWWWWWWWLWLPLWLWQWWWASTAHIHCCCCVLLRHWKINNQVPGTRHQHPYYHHPLTSSNSSSGILLLLVVGVAVVVAGAAGCGGGGGGGEKRLYVDVVLVVNFNLVCTWYQVKGFCAEAHRLTIKAISQGYYCINARLPARGLVRPASSQSLFRSRQNVGTYAPASEYEALIRRRCGKTSFCTYDNR